VTNLTQLRKTLAERLTGRMVRLLAKTPITPSSLTWFGFVLSVAAAVFIAGDNLIAAGVLLLLGGFFDMLDGALARHTEQVTRFGAMLDSTLDRLSEAALLVGVLVLWASEDYPVGILLAGITLTASLLVSYIRARAEALGLECHSGIFTRPERVIVLALGLLTDQLFMALIIIVALSLFTILQRLVSIRRQLKT
jgi:CDP-diacylglycerol--glycerol-3-phosphate 3-phosphatidyltransferase